MDAIYQCYEKNKDVEYVLENFYKHGGGIVYLLSDCGNDFSYLKDVYKDRLIYKYNTEKTWCTRYGWSSKAQALHWMVWFTEACRCLNSDYIILLEDDVLINGDLNSIKIDHEISGPDKHCCNLMDKEILDYLFTLDPNNYDIPFYGGCGGSIMNRKIIAKGEFQYLLNKHYDALTSVSNKAKFSDVMLTILFRMSGYAYGANKDYTEAWINRNWRVTGEKIIHQYDEPEI